MQIFELKYVKLLSKQLNLEQMLPETLKLILILLHSDKILYLRL